MKLIKLFNLVKSVSKQINKKNPNVNGLAFWQPIKAMLDIPGKAKKWKKIPAHILKPVMNNIAEYHVNAKKEEQLVEHAHFIIQTVRIPLTENPTIRKIIQIALNIGQCQGKGSKYDVYLKNRTRITDYISNEDINQLSSQIPDSTMKQVEAHLQKWKNKI